MNSICRQDYWGIITLDFDVTDQILIMYSPSSNTREKIGIQWGSMTFIDFMKAWDSIRREVLCNTLIEVVISMKTVRLSEICMMYLIHSVFSKRIEG
jgi:hypothetical protein